MKLSSTQIFLFSLFTLLGFDKALAQCSPVATAQFDVNNSVAYLLQGGLLWKNDNYAGFIAPKNNITQVASIFSGSIWLAGLDPGGNLKLAAPTYGNPTAVNAGPMIGGATDPAVCENFNRFWPITQASINAHLNDFADNGSIDNIEVTVIGWPGRGNPDFETIYGFALPDIELAPFVDLNGNGIYEPLLGEYPDIKGEEAIWWVFNYSQGIPITMSVLAYGYSSNDEVVDNTTFYEMKFTNDGSEKIDSTFIGLWLDPDIGCYTDDYVGCLPEHNLAFAYNQDVQDGEVGCLCSGGVPTYCEEIPVLGIKILKGATGGFGEDLGLSRFIYYNYPFTGNPASPLALTDPNTAIEYYHILNGKWKDGTPLTTGGDGYDSVGVETFFAMAGNPANLDDWTMCSENLDSYDPRMVMSSGPFSIGPGEANSFSFALIWLPNQNYPCPDVTPLIDAGDVAQDIFEGLTSSHETPGSNIVATASPNPFSSDVTIKVSGNAVFQGLELYAVDGKLVRSFKNLESNKVTISRNDLSPGMYFYKALLKNGGMVSGKLVAR
ncbi:MAG: T9SS type A sorting domain-containing protein [Lewinellaceae bacterium]|nr:T9SS type A sorting domain-containing protein [Saprospiraceae bacterium]MCB9337445.1 T9SS type A sorting domain-containing protein [Lewinellaceae bacterium]